MVAAALDRIARIIRQSLTGVLSPILMPPKNRLAGRQRRDAGTSTVAVSEQGRVRDGAAVALHDQGSDCRLYHRIIRRPRRVRALARRSGVSARILRQHHTHHFKVRVPWAR